MKLEIVRQKFYLKKILIKHWMVMYNSKILISLSESTLGPYIFYNFNSYLNQKTRTRPCP